MGLAGAGHCMAMCGGLAAAFGDNISRWQLLLYNLGRVSAYTLAGALIGAASMSLVQVSPDSLNVLRALSSLFLVALGLYLGGWWFGLSKLERLGLPLWRRVQPLAVKIRQRQTNTAKFGAGFIWGWLPCGLVYSALTWATLQANWFAGGLVMLAFGLGTLPAMYLFGVFSRTLMSIIRSSGFRKAMGVLFIVYGVWTGLTLVKQGWL
ncbi:sulfite exporter TauE/SafE family protein [Thalassospira xiamenensis]|nr:sulfite exporter TauE/SafE family protein [Thalassospira xiamenensis]